MNTSPLDLEVARRDLGAPGTDPASRRAGHYRWESWLYATPGSAGGRASAAGPTRPPPERRRWTPRPWGRHRHRRYASVDITKLSG
ncbi:hypothetical protein GCM10022220_53280 [Actinocatenispora rupis]|uniref:Uncharacterized protein n=1 Tax=Actinocatenispora rupis TaxID=519421 RepID=A0A8J3IVA1_9ACTN|nr:hypothetical protein Aru02nite_00990 [Actinocatenispora rupis]